MVCIYQFENTYWNTCVKANLLKLMWKQQSFQHRKQSKLHNTMCRSIMKSMVILSFWVYKNVTTSKKQLVDKNRCELWWYFVLLRTFQGIFGGIHRSSHESYGDIHLFEIISLTTLRVLFLQRACKIFHEYWNRTFTDYKKRCNWFLKNLQCRCYGNDSRKWK